MLQNRADKHAIIKHIRAAADAADDEAEVINTASRRTNSANGGGRSPNVRVSGSQISDVCCACQGRAQP